MQWRKSALRRIEDDNAAYKSQLERCNLVRFESPGFFLRDALRRNRRCITLAPPSRASENLKEFQEES